MGKLASKHFGHVFFKVLKPSEKFEIRLYFENNLYINTLKDSLTRSIESDNVMLSLSLQTHQATATRYKKSNYTKVNSLWQVEETLPCDEYKNKYLPTLQNLLITILENDLNLEG